MVQKALWAVALLAVFAPVSAQDEKPAVQDGVKSGEAKTSFLDEEFPFEGEVTAERLNVRLFPKPDAATSIVATVLGQGEKLTVVAQKDDFFQILPPRGTSVWVWARNVKKETDDAGTVIGNDVPVRLDSRANADQLGTMKEGAKVKILREHLGWFQIFPPDTVKYFVAKKYVKYLGKATAAVTPSDKQVPKALPDAEAQSKLAEAEALATEQNEFITAKELDKLNFAKVAEAFEAAAALAKSDELKKQAEARAKTYRQLEAHWALVQKNLQLTEEKLRLLRQEIENKNKPEEKKWEFTGHVDTVGRMFNRPGTHKLVSGGKIVCFLRAKDDSEEIRQQMNGLWDRYVGVRGTVQKLTDSWDGYSVVIVEAIEEVVKK
jgi:SH3-like domain-containing protein